MFATPGSTSFLFPAKMKILVVGAAGGTGVEICRYALGRSHEVTALVRTPAKFPAAVNARLPKEEAAKVLASVKVVKADAQVSSEVTKVITEGAFDAVLVALGAAGIMKRDVQCSLGTKNVIDALTAEAAMAAPNPAGGPRLVVCTTMGASETKPLMPSFVQWMLKHVLGKCQYLCDVAFNAVSPSPTYYSR